jgi:hypothetical protein
MHASISAARIRWAVVAALAILGLVIGLAVTSSPPYRSRAIVLMPPGMTHTGRFLQAVKVTSGPVLAGAARRLGLRAGSAGLLGRISVTLPARATAPARLAIEITATGATRNSARRTVTAVTTSFIRYITTWGRTAFGHHHIRDVTILGPPAPLPRGSWLRAAIRPAALGLLSGLALGLLLLLLISGRTNARKVVIIVTAVIIVIVVTWLGLWVHNRSGLRTSAAWSSSAAMLALIPGKATKPSGDV